MNTIGLPPSGIRSWEQDSKTSNPWGLARPSACIFGVAMLLASLTSTAFASGETFYGLSKDLIGMEGPDGFGVSLDELDRSSSSTSSAIGTVDAISEARGMAMDPVTGTMYAISSNKGSDTELYTIDLTNANGSLVGTIQNAAGTTNPLVRDITFDHTGQLWGVTGSMGDDPMSVLPINKATAVVGSVLTTASGDSQATIAFRPADRQLYVLSFSGATRAGTSYRFERIDRGTGASTPLSLSGSDPGANVLGMVFDRLADLFRFFDNSGAYWTLSPTGTLTDTGNSNGNIYFGISFDQATTVPVELMSFEIE